MTAIGAVLAGIAVCAAVLALRRTSDVTRRLRLFFPDGDVPHRVRSFLVTEALERSGLGWTAHDLIRAKLLAALVSAGLVVVLMTAMPIGPTFVLAAGYAGFVAPTLIVERAAGRRRVEAEAATAALVEWSEALVASGRPVETAVIAVASRGVGAALVDGVLSRAADAYTLGAPLFAVLVHEARAAGLERLADVAVDLDRSRGLGRGALTVLRDQRDRLRAAERAGRLDAAGRVEGHLMLVLVLCYLPALMLLVVVPLFLGLLEGLLV